MPGGLNADDLFRQPVAFRRFFFEEGKSAE